MANFQHFPTITGLSSSVLDNVTFNTRCKLKEMQVEGYYLLTVHFVLVL